MLVHARIDFFEGTEFTSTRESFWREFMSLTEKTDRESAAFSERAVTNELRIYGSMPSVLEKYLNIEGAQGDIGSKWRHRLFRSDRGRITVKVRNVSYGS